MKSHFRYLLNSIPRFFNLPFLIKFQLLISIVDCLITSLITLLLNLCEIHLWKVTVTFFFSSFPPKCWNVLGGLLAKSEYLPGWNKTDKDYCWLVVLDFAFLWGKSIKWPAFKFIDFFFLPLLVAVLLRARDVWSEGSFRGRVDGWVPPYLLQWLTHSKIKHRQLRELDRRLLLSSGVVGCGNPPPTACMLS